MGTPSSIVNSSFLPVKPCVMPALSPSPIGPRGQGIPNMRNVAGYHKDEPKTGLFNPNVFGSPGSLTANCTPRMRPSRWKTLCRYTVPFGQPYPPESSHSTLPSRCTRGAACFYGHHGDRYLDVPESGSLSFDSFGQPHYNEARDMSNSGSSTVTEGYSSRNSTGVGGGEDQRGFRQTQLAESWLEKRSEWRKREVAMSARPGLGPENTGKGLRWEDNYKSSKPRSRNSGPEKKAGWPKHREFKSVRTRNAEWSDYSTARRKRSSIETLNHWTGGLEYTATANGHEVSNKRVRNFDLDLRGGATTELGSDQAKDSLTEDTTQRDKEEDEGSSSASSSSIEFIIPPFVKGLRPKPNTLGAGNIVDLEAKPSLQKNPTPPSQFVVTESSSSPIKATGSSLDPSAQSFIPYQSCSAPQTPARIAAGHSFRRGREALNHSPQTPSATAPMVVVSNPPSAEGGMNISLPLFNTTNTGFPQYQLPCQIPNQSQPMGHITNHEAGAPTPTVWNQSLVNPKLGHYSQQAIHTPPVVSRTSSIRSHAPSASPTPTKIRNRESGIHSLHHSAPPHTPQSHINHTLDQVKVMLSLYPDCENKKRTISLLDSLIVPDGAEDVDAAGYSMVAESLQTGLHRLHFSITDQEWDVMENFSSEMLNVHAYLTGGGGPVRILGKREEEGWSDPAKGHKGFERKSSDQQSPKLHSSQNQSPTGDFDDENDENDLSTPPGNVTDSIGSNDVDTDHNEASNATVSAMSVPQIHSHGPGADNVPLPSEDAFSEDDLWPLWSGISKKCLSGDRVITPEVQFQRFFLSAEMELYLEDSYYKVLEVQTAISLKWRRIRKVFEREWCSGISRYARKGVVTRALWNVYAMEEEDWLVMKNPHDLSDEDLLEQIEDLRNRQPESPDQWQIEILRRKEAGTTPRPVWDRRGLCMEADPMKLSEEGEYLCKLIEKMCLIKVMGFEEIHGWTGGRFMDGCTLPPCPETSFFPQDFPVDGMGAQGDAPLGSVHRRYWLPWEVVPDDSMSPSVQSPDFFEVNRFGLPRGRPILREFEGWMDPYYPELEEEPPGFQPKQSAMKFASEGDTIHYLIKTLKLVPRLISCPVLDPHLANLGSTYQISPGLGKAESVTEITRESLAKGKFLEMCHLDRMLFVGYVVLEILNLWEDQRKDVGRVRWRFPEPDVELGNCSAERVRCSIEHFLRKTEEMPEKVFQKVSTKAPEKVSEEEFEKAAQKMIEKSPEKIEVPQVLTWSDIAQGKGKVEGKHGSEATMILSETPQSTTGPVTPQKNTDPTMPLNTSPQTRKHRQPGSGLLYTEILKRKAAMKQENARIADTARGGGPSVETNSAPGDQPVVSRSAPDKQAKIKREKKRHGFDLDDTVEYQKSEIVKIPPPASVSDPKDNQSKVDSAAESIAVTPAGEREVDVADASDGQEMEREDVARDEERLYKISRKSDEFKTRILQYLVQTADGDIKMEMDIIRHWLRGLQDWLWMYNEGVGVNFVENIRASPGKTLQESSLDDDGADVEGGHDEGKAPCGRKKIRRGGKRNKNKQSGQQWDGAQSGGEMNVDKSLGKWRREIVEGQMREVGMRFMRGALPVVKGEQAALGSEGKGEERWWVKER